MPRKKLPSQKYLKECFDYSPYLGTLYWKDRPRNHFKTDLDRLTFNNRNSGRAAGTDDREGYAEICIGRVRYLAHRIIWKIMTGREPPDQIDHRDCNGMNNTFRNLREATPSQNNYNKGPQINNKLGLKGVYKKGFKYRAEITVEGIRHRLGYFNTPEEAHAAYKKAARNLHKEFANSG